MNSSHDSPRPVRPGEYPLWEEALSLVGRDLDALLPGRGPLRLLALPSWDEEEAEDGPGHEHVYVALPDGRWHGDHLWHGSASDPDTALAEVAEAAQETVLECLWQVWPVCGEHGLGMHAGQEDGRAVWRCAGGVAPGGPAHVRAAVGELDAPHRPRRARRKLR
ncbi:hypothetical protein [Streptomyces sp. NPDC088766]|uniref:hypothetical protein n=1 Tax=Streptomyces sp. NPDC088766 TaxID=3365893 RepID=UPI0038261191